MTETLSWRDGAKNPGRRTQQKYTGVKERKELHTERTRDLHRVSSRHSAEYWPVRVYKETTWDWEKKHPKELEETISSARKG